MTDSPSLPSESTTRRGETILRATGLSAGYGHQPVLEKVNLDVCVGDTVAVVGPSGSGKSTLLKCLTLLHPPTEGIIVFRDEQLCRGPDYLVRPHRIRQRLGLVHQEFNLWPDRNVLHNLIDAPRALGREDRVVCVRRARHWLERFGITGFEHRYPNELSGGQKQRVAIARSLMMEPEVLLLDEPTSSLDVESAAQLLRSIEDLQRTLGLTIVLVTHHLQFARRCASRLVVLLEGRVAAEGPPAQVMDKPTSERVERFFALIAEAR